MAEDKKQPCQFCNTYMRPLHVSRMSEYVSWICDNCRAHTWGYRGTERSMKEKDFAKYVEGNG
jgi:ribosomal protein L37AE/L43A